MNIISTTPSPRQIDAALTLLRVIVGIVFIAHGGQKLFVYGLDGVAGSFGQMGVPMAAVIGPLVAFLEFFGGIALVLGLLTRVAGLALAGVMAGAMLFVHLPNGFFAPGGIEFPLTLATAAAALAIVGPGALSLDRRLASARAGTR